MRRLRLMPALPALIVFCLAAIAPRDAAAGRAREIRGADGVTLIDVLPKSGIEGGPGDAAPPALTSFSWQLQSTSNAVFTDLSMADATHGFASAELGRVFRTTDGQHWSQVLNQGFPYYWYGVQAFSADTVLVTGFNNTTGEGVARWSGDGGLTWGPVFTIDPTGWLTIVQFADRLHGVATDIGGGKTWVTTSGGGTAADWSPVVADTTGGWFEGNFTFLAPDLQVFLCGISFCRSRNAGLSYTRGPSVDAVFDGGNSFPDTVHGWTGGGQISTPVSGWVHRTTDGGQTWSGRILNTPYPIRALLFLDSSTGFASGGNYYTATGGIWSTVDGGNNWNLDVTTGCEMKGLDMARVNPDSVDFWCAGSTSGVGRIYHTRVRFPAPPASVEANGPPRPQLPVAVNAWPNPSRASTAFAIRSERALRDARLLITDASGRLVCSIACGQMQGGTVNFAWDGRDTAGRAVPSGVYFYRLAHADGETLAQKLILVR